jgi:hypothetical protein
LLCGIAIESIRIFLGIDEVRLHVVFHDLGHQTGYSASNSCDEMHDLIAASFPVQGALDAVDLTTDAAHARQQLLLFTDGM